MKKRVNLFILSVIISVLMCSAVVYAAPVALSKDKATDVMAVPAGSTTMSTLSAICNDTNATFNKYVLSTYVVPTNPQLGTQMYFYGTEYDSLTPEKRRECMEYMLKRVTESGLSAKEKNKVYNFIAKQDPTVSQALKYLENDTNADLVKAGNILRPFTGGISTFTGVVSLLVFLFLGIGILMDVAYLALPGLQLILERGDERKKPFGVSVEAWKANREVGLNPDNNENVISNYLKRRLIVILVCAVCILYLTTGKVYDVLTYIADAFLR